MKSTTMYWLMSSSGYLRGGFRLYLSSWPMRNDVGEAHQKLTVLEDLLVSPDG